MTISKIKALEILDSRGVPTISTTLVLSDGSIGKGDVPSGSSTGDTEVFELRDGDKDRYMGKGVLKAVDIVNTVISKELIGKNFECKKHEFYISRSWGALVFKVWLTICP